MIVGGVLVIHSPKSRTQYFVDAHVNIWKEDMSKTRAICAKEGERSVGADYFYLLGEHSCSAEKNIIAFQSRRYVSRLTNISLG